MAEIIGPEECFDYEKEIIWLEDPSKYPWVRQCSVDFLQKQGISNSRMSDISGAGHKIIGYANLEDDAPQNFIDETTGNKHYWRRYFYLRDKDYENYQGGTSYPLEAVDPLSVTPQDIGDRPPKKSQIAVRIPFPLMRKLKDYINQTKMSQTEVVVSALAEYLEDKDSTPLIHRILLLEKRVEALESRE
ncbi:MAG: DUF6009 family protein [Cyanobacteria bacterium P01_H01_bin.35]